MWYIILKQITNIYANACTNSKNMLSSLCKQEVYICALLIDKQLEIRKDNKILYNKLYYIDKFGTKKNQKKFKPIFQSTRNLFYGNKKNEIASYLKNLGLRRVI